MNKPEPTTEWEHAAAAEAAGTVRYVTTRRQQRMLLLVPRIVVLATGPILAKLVFSSLRTERDLNTAGDLVASVLTLGLASIGAVVALLVVWIFGWIAIGRS